ncbi:MAG: tetraacyldisaccharide 4'-kinase, partial [Candidatus Aminicenantes bacterium]|nr:tetraacyldisaccharide 4'-kinase [Candidatus Aminicenantes bacterium]
LIEKRADTGAKGRLKKRFPQSDIFEYTVQNRGFFRPGKNEQESRDRLEQKRVLAFCGIARPQRFLTQLQKENIRPACLLKFPDHHPYPASSVKSILEEFRRANAEALITTEKDAVKIRDARDLAPLPVYYLKIDLELERGFYLNISSLLERI